MRAASDPQRPTRLQALIWALGASAYFMILYNGANWLASRRAHVGSLHFDWELRIPFVAAMIVPYMSIDLFFFFSPFLCRDRRELRTHGRRLLLAIGSAVVCFVLFPLRIGFVRPPVSGVYGWLFDLLGGFDMPFNLLPSLHIALLTLLWVLYTRHTRGLVRRILQGWFVLIAFSAVLTYQRHLIDVAGGFALGVLCLYLAPDDARARTAHLPVAVK